VKATIEIDDELYRQVKAAAAIRGRKVKDLVAEGLRFVLRSSLFALRTPFFPLAGSVCRS
jgi:hypothetical protein